jgi:hypothetical protein
MKRLLAELIGLIVCLLLAEILVRGFVPTLYIERGLWYHSDVGWKLNLIKTQADKIKVIAVGDSTVLDGFNAIQFDSIYKEQTGNNTYSFNLGTSNASPTVVNFNLQHAYLNQLHPQAIIYPVALSNLTPSSNVDWSPLFNQSIMEPTISGRNKSVLANIDLWLLENSALYRLRGSVSHFVANPAQWPFNPVQPFDNRGFASLKTQFSKTKPVLVKELQTKIKKAFENYQTDSSAFRQLEKIVAYAEKNGIKIYIVAQPPNPRLIAYLPHGKADYEAFLSLMDEFCQKHSLPLLTTNLDQWSQMVNDDNYADFRHLNGSGAAIFTQMVAEWYSRVAP